MNEEASRRQYLATLSAVSAMGLAGCTQTGSESQPTETATPTANLGGANFTFEYATQQQQVTVQFNGGARVLAGDLQVRSTAGLQVQWAELGSTVAGPDDPIQSGASAVLGEGIINWGQAVGPDETIRLVHVGGETPATLGRFTPTESATLTATVPTATPEPTEEPTAEPTATPTPEPTETPTPEPPDDTTAPSITAFSLSNPSGQELRTSFESDEALTTIQVTLSGAETATLVTDDFTEGTSGDTYTYEATYAGDTDGSYTATLDEAADTSGNDGSSGQSVTVSVTTATADVTVDGFEDGDTSAWSSTGTIDSTFSASEERASAGSWSARFAEGSTEDGTAEWTASGETVQPTTVETAHALEDGQIYADSNTEWRLGETTILRVNYNWSNNFCAVNGTGADADDNTGAVVADLPWPSSDGFFHVVLDDIDWDANEVGEVRVNGTVEAENVDFFNDGEGIDRTAVYIGGNGDNEMFVDDTTIPEQTETEPVTAPTVDGFEDGDTSEWSSTGTIDSTFQASQDRAYAGSWAAEFLEGSTEDGTAEWTASGETVQPTTVETAHALEDGQIYADSNTEWRLGETTVLRINYNWSNNFCAVNGSGADASDNTGAVVADLPWPSSDGFFHVVLDDIDWDANEVGEVRVNGTVEAENVAFFNDASGIDRTAVYIGGNGNNQMFVDDTTIP